MADYMGYTKKTVHHIEVRVHLEVFEEVLLVLELGKHPDDVHASVGHRFAR